MSDGQKIQKFGVILEEINSQMKTVVEATKSSEERITTQLTAFEKRTEQRFNMVEAAITMHSKEIKELKGDVKES